MVGRDGEMICQICESVPGIRNFGVIICHSCLFFFKRSVVNVIVYKCICKVKSNSQQPCKACRIQKCHKLKMAATNIQNLTPLTENQDEASQIFSDLLENLIETCNANAMLTHGYILNGNRAVLDIATLRYAERKPTMFQTKYKQLWSAMLFKHKITWQEIPVVLDLTLRLYFPDITKLVDPDYGEKNEKDQMKDVNESEDRMEQLKGLCHYLLSAILPVAEM